MARSVFVRPNRYLKNEIVRADAQDLAKYVRPGSVALTVTSPPYRNAIDYSQHVSNTKSGGKVWMRGTGKATTREYLSAMRRIFGQVFEVTREGGCCCIVIGDEVVDGKLVPLPSLLLSELVNLENEDEPGKWRLRDVIVWHKVTSGRNGSGNRCGMFIKIPRPGYYRANIMHEYILVLQKGRRVASRSQGKIPLNRVVKRELANSIWNIAPVPPGTTSHPVPFPEEIPWRLIRLFTKKGDLVLDPMNGSGQTTKVAHGMDRQYVGLDVEKTYVDEAKKRLKRGVELRGHLIPVFHKETWADDDQGGFFETREVDLSKNIPGGYEYSFHTAAAKPVRGHKSLYLYYEKNRSFLCFIFHSAGKHSRLNLGKTRERGSVLHRVLTKLPETPFAKTDIESVETRIIENRHTVKASMDVLERLKYVQRAGKKYEMTPTGKRLRRRLVG